MAKVVPTGWNKRERMLYAGHEVLVTGNWDRLAQAEVIFQEGPLKGEKRWFKVKQLSPPPLRPGAVHLCPRCGLEFGDAEDDRGDVPTVQAPAGEDREGMVRDLPGSAGLGPEEEGVPVYPRPSVAGRMYPVWIESTREGVAPASRARLLQEQGMEDPEDGRAGLVDHADLNALLDLITKNLDIMNKRIDAFEEMILRDREAKANG